MPKIITLDSQILSAIMKCERYAELTFIDNIGAMEKPEHLDKGDVLHICLDKHYSLKRDHPELSYADIVEQSAQTGQERGYEVDAPIEVSLDVIKTYKQYAEFYKGEDWIPLQTEHVFAKEMHVDENLQIIYQGKIDLIVDSIAGHQIVDHKSSSRRTDPIFLSNQFIGYCWAMNVFNMTINEVGFQKTLAPAEKYRRHIFSYPKELVDEWIQTSVFHVKEFVKRVEEQYFPPRYTSCRGLYGECIFVPVCQSTPDARQWKLKSQYSVREPWDVGAKLKGEENVKEESGARAQVPID